MLNYPLLGVRNVRYKQNMEKPRAFFPCFISQYKFRWKILHAIRVIYGKFSIYQHC